MTDAAAKTPLLLATLFVSVIAALDLTIVSVALPYMSGSLSATPDTITWVVTMFTVGQALVIGATGLLSRLLGRKRLALIAVAGFVASSAACGLAQSLDQMVVFRFVQGLFSGPLIPLSQSVLVDAYPPAQRTKVMSYWAMGVMGGPAIGPMIGGWLAQDFDWRWNFYVNLPLGALALALVARTFPTTPPQPERADWRGFLLLFVFVVSLQIALDQGDVLDWSSSRAIVLLAVTAFTAGVAFVARGVVVGERNLMKLRLFGDVNFAASAALISIVGIGMLGFLVLVPAYLVDTLGWEEVTAGLVVGGAGGAGLVAAAISGRLAPVLGTRPLIGLGALVTSAAWLRMSQLDLDVSPAQVLLPGALLMFGIQLAYSPIAAQAFLRVPARDRDEAAGLFNFVKTLGFSFGTTLVSVLVYRGAQRDWNLAVGFLDPSNGAYQRAFTRIGVDPATPEAAAIASALLQQHTAMVTIVKTAEVMAVLALLALPLCLLLAPPPKGEALDLAAAAG